MGGRHHVLLGAVAVVASVRLAPATLATAAALLRRAPLRLGRRAPSGCWSSPVTSALIVKKAVQLGSPSFGPDGALYWVEGRAEEAGRRVLVRRRSNGKVEEVTPPRASGFSVCSRVHEYGGAAYVVTREAVYFVNAQDQQVYVQQLTGEAAPGAAVQLTHGDTNTRYADLQHDPTRQRLLAVCEQHVAEGVKNFIVAIDTVDGKCSVLVEGADFYHAPRVSGDGAHLCWISWNHPHMPWDDTHLWRGKFDSDGCVTAKARRHVAGGPNESILQPEWREDGALVFLSDRSGWWNLYVEKHEQVVALCPKAAEFGGPSWMFGLRYYALLPDGHILAAMTDPAAMGEKLLLLDTANGTGVVPTTPSALVLPPSKPIGSAHNVVAPYNCFRGTLIACVQDGRVQVACVGGSTARPLELGLLKVADVEALTTAVAAQWVSVKKASATQLSERYISQPRKIRFPTANGEIAYMNYYPPANPHHTLPTGQKPALLVKIHGGPTSAASPAFSLETHFWTTRGFAVADIDYRGSTGYGRQYRNRLKGEWGVADVEDCIHAAKFLVANDLADKARLCINGSSAGGLTSLASLLGDTVFKAAASRYGVADLELLAKETHKFESRYLDTLVGPYPEDRDKYRERSPITHVDTLNAPVIFYQGDLDAVVPPNQAELMHAKLKARGLPTALVMYNGEYHGFRQDVNIRHTLDSELYFYGRILGFKAEVPSGQAHVEIDNLSAARSGKGEPRNDSAVHVYIPM